MKYYRCEICAWDALVPCPVHVLDPERPRTISDIRECAERTVGACGPNAIYAFASDVIILLQELDKANTKIEALEQEARSPDLHEIFLP